MRWLIERGFKWIRRPTRTRTGFEDTSPEPIALFKSLLALAGLSRPCVNVPYRLVLTETGPFYFLE